MNKTSSPDRKKPALGRVIAIVLYMLLGGVFGAVAELRVIAMLDNGVPFHTAALTAAGLLLGFIFTLYFQVIIHELGHLVFGLATGYRFVSFRVGSLMWIKKDGKIRFKRFSLMGTGGQCLMDPPEMRDGRYPYRLYNLGGVIFNLAASLIAFAVFLLFGSNFYVFFFTLMSFLTGIVFALANGIPMHMGAVDNDGYNALNLSGSPDTMRCLWAQLRINALLSGGVRLKDMPEELFAPPSEKNAICSYIWIVASMRAMDSMDFASARAFAENALLPDSGTLPIHRFIIASEMIYWELVDENRPEVIEEYRSGDFKRYEKAMRSYPSLIRTQYAFELLYKRDEEAAGKKLAHFEKAVKSYPNECEIAAERELIAYAKKVYNGRNAG